MRSNSSEVRPGVQVDTTMVCELLDHLDAMVAYWNADRVCVIANAAYRDWFGRTQVEVVAMTMQSACELTVSSTFPSFRATGDTSTPTAALKLLKT